MRWLLTCEGEKERSMGEGLRLILVVNIEKGVEGGRKGERKREK
jgi:hypothetical protein